MHNKNGFGRFLGIVILALFVSCIPISLIYGAGESPTATLNGQSTSDLQAQSSAQLQQEFESAKNSIKGFAVESAAEYKRIRDYYDSLVSDEAAVHRFTTQEGDSCLCIDIYRQSSIPASGLAGTRVTLEPIVQPANPPSSSASAQLEKPVLPGSQWLDGSQDESGNLRQCPGNSFPKLLPRFEALCRYKTLDHYFEKNPFDKTTVKGKQAVNSVPDLLGVTYTHEYAYAIKSLNNIGQGADFSIWNPYTENAGEFSLSQLWCTRGSGTGLQTVELGWQNYKQKYGDYQSRLFIYYTVNGYSATGDNKGCYNLDCKGFVQTNKDIILGGRIKPVSTVGGAQYVATLEAYRDPKTGHWWIRYGGSTWVGYYPTKLFSTAGLKKYSAVVEMGGEILDDKIGGHTATDMGSGRFAEAGWKKAAFTKKIHYWNPSNSYVNVTGLSPQATNTSYYDILLYKATDANWKTYFYFGGPGR